LSHVVDASVWVSDLYPLDVNHAASRRYFERVRDRSEWLLEPNLLLCECAGAMSRRTQNRLIAAGVVVTVSATPNVTLEALTPLRAEEAATVAANHAIRGADSVYVQLASESGAILITWDNEMLARAPVVVQTMTPGDWLAANP